MSLKSKSYIIQKCEYLEYIFLMLILAAETLYWVFIYL